MAVSIGFDEIKNKMLILEKDQVSGRSDDILKEYVTFSTDVVNRDINAGLQNEAVVYLALHYLIANRGAVSTSSKSGGGGQPQGTYLSEKTVGDITVRYGAYDAKVAEKTINTIGRTKYYEMYLLLKGESIDQNKGGKTQKVREPLETDSWG